MGVDTVYKIVPVGGEVEINDVEQTSFENAFQEIVVSRKLSDLAGDQVLDIFTLTWGSLNESFKVYLGYKNWLLQKHNFVDISKLYPFL